MIEELQLNTIDISNIDLNTFYKMKFIYNAICNGWTVKKISKNKFEFKNCSNNVKKQFNLENFLDNFIEKNLKIEPMTVDNN